MNTKKIALLLLPTVLLSGCGKNKIHESTPKEIVWKSYEGKDLEKTRKTAYTYDKKGRTTCEVDYIFDEKANEYVKERKTEFVSDKKGRDSALNAYEYVDGVEKLVSKTVYTYDGDKFVKEELYDYDEQGNGFIWYFTEYKDFDELNRPATQLDYSYNEETNKLELSDESHYEYEKDFVEFKKCTATWLESEMVITREFDDEGRIVWESGKSGSYHTEEFTIYNEFGMIQSSASYFVYDDTGDHHLQSMTDYTYIDKYYLAEECTTFVDDFGNVKNFDSETYTYDKKMNILSHDSYEFDFESKELVVTDQREYVY